ncbi:hypothetical protein PgNI_11273, partial [Pyricularia grisea]|uniref:Yippee domain-containing protein n=1 Tax=Pyricularia grisea TaxID=148305 RepID=A0A6P8APE5_PYRGI
SFPRRAWPRPSFPKGSQHIPGEAREARHVTGRHVMRDAQCVGCEVGIGWVYDKEWEESQRYKEGMNIFEMELVISKES